jgi:hypothetical protein
MHNFSGQHPATLVAEITRQGAAAALAPDAAAGLVLRDLRLSGLLADEAAVEFVDTRLEKHTYPIPTLGLAAARRGLERRLAQRRVRLLGRSGRWDYLNTDGIFRAVDEFMRDDLPELERLA